jgi:hypothetical protein
VGFFPWKFFFDQSPLSLLWVAFFLTSSRAVGAVIKVFTIIDNEPFHIWRAWFLRGHVTRFNTVPTTFFFVFFVSILLLSYVTSPLRIWLSDLPMIPLFGFLDWWVLQLCRLFSHRMPKLNSFLNFGIFLFLINLLMSYLSLYLSLYLRLYLSLHLIFYLRFWFSRLCFWLLSHYLNDVGWRKNLFETVIRKLPSTPFNKEVE